MELPSTVRIGYETYKIVPMPDAEALEGDFGATDQLIRIKVTDRSPRFVANTFLHEVLHGVFYQAGLRDSLSINHAKEEAIVNCLANGLSQVFRDNPNLLKMLTK